MVLADQKDYKRGYKKHYSTYQLLNLQKGSVSSKRLLLAYTVECGLKYKLLEKWDIRSTSEIREILKDKNHPRHSILGTHDLRKIIKELGQEGQFDFPQIRTNHKDHVSIEEYHQMQRYGIAVDDRDTKKEERFEEVLRQVADWIQKGI